MRQYSRCSPSLLLAIVLTMLRPAQAAPATHGLRLLAGSGSNLLTLDPATGKVLNTVTVTLSGAPVSGLVSLAEDPTSGSIYMQTDAGLLSVDSATGEATLLVPGSVFASLALTSSGALYGVQFNAALGIDLLEADKATGAITSSTHLFDAPTDQQFPFAVTALTFNNSDGQLYAFAYNYDWEGVLRISVSLIDPVTGSTSSYGYLDLGDSAPPFSTTAFTGQTFATLKPDGAIYLDLFTYLSTPEVPVVAIAFSGAPPDCPPLAKLYGTAPAGWTTLLYAIDPAAPSVELVGAVGDAQVSALSFGNNGVLFAVAGYPDRTTLATIDPCTGSIHDVGLLLGGSGSANDLAVATDGTLLGTDGRQLLSMDRTTGATTVVGNPALPDPITGLDFDAATQRPLAITSSSANGSELFAVDPVTAAPQGLLLLSPPAGAGLLLSADTDPADGKQYTLLNNSGETSLARIDAAGSEGHLTAVAPLTPHINALAFSRGTPASTYSLTVSVAAGSGTLRSLDGKINCPSQCTADYASGSQVTLVEMPGTGFIFDQWGGACGVSGSGSAQCALTLTTDLSATADFTDHATLKLHVVDLQDLETEAMASGSVWVSPGNTNCSSDCTLSFPLGQTVTLTASPDLRSVISHWVADSVCNGGWSRYSYQPSCAVTMDVNRDVTAVFDVAAQVTVQFAGDGAGNVSDDEGFLNCSADCTASLPVSRTAHLVATPASGNFFGGWGGTCYGTARDCSFNPTVTLPTNAVSVEFNTTETYHVLLYVRGRGHVTSSPPGLDCRDICNVALPVGPVTLTATPDAGATFNGWSSSVCGDQSACVFSLNQAQTITANFTDVTWKLSLSFDPPFGRNGSVNASPGNLSCDVACTSSYLAGIPLVLAASPASGYGFSGWTGACTGTGSCTVTMDGDRSVGARFAPISDVAIALTASPEPVASGAQIYYEIQVRTQGPQAAEGVVITDTLPAGVTLVSFTENRGCTASAGVVTCALPFGVGTLGYVGITIVVQTAAAGPLSNTVVATSTAIDNNNANNEVIVTSTVLPAPDTQAPAVTITAPAAGSSAAGTAVQLAADASDNVAIAGVLFKVDGVSIAAEVTAPPYRLGWDTTRFSNAAHAITATARDAAGNATTSTAVMVTVNNSTEFAFPPAGSVQALSTPAGGTAHLSLSITPASGFTGPVSFTCSGAPAGAVCTVSPNPATISGTGATAITVTVTTSPRSRADLGPVAGLRRSPPTAWLPWGLLAAVFPAAWSRRRRIILALLLALFLCLALSTCGGGSSVGTVGGAVSTPVTMGTPPGTYPLTLTGSAGTVSHSFSLTLTIT